jgi:hypothetical protein
MTPPGRRFRPSSAVEKLVKDLRKALLDRIVEAGFVREEHRSTLGVLRSTRWPAVRPEHETEIRRALDAAVST